MTNENLLIGKQKDIIFDSETTDGKNKISKIRNDNLNALIVFASGCMDIAQAGHPLFTEQLRLVGEKLINDKEKNLNKKSVIVVVGIGRDTTLKTLKEGRPINSEMNRAYIVASYKEVDYIVINNISIGEGKIDFKEVLGILKPDVFVLNSDDSAIDVKRKMCENLGIIFETVDRVVPDFLIPSSSTKIIEKIKKSN